jgi:hypothetical protein
MIKNFLCNIPMYIGLGVLFIGLGFKKVAEKCMEISFRLHIYFNTLAGQRLVQYGTLIKKQAMQMKEATQDNQLAKILLREDNGRKPTDN